MTISPAPLDPQVLLSHRDWVRAVARALTRDEHAARDAAQEAFTAALDRPPPRVAGLKAWLAQVVRNSVVDEHRRTARRTAREHAAARPESVGSTSAAVAAAEAHRLVVDAVLALPPMYRDAVLLRYFEELPPREIAARLGEPVETVRTRLRRAMPRLRKLLAGDRDDPAAWLGAIAPLTALPYSVGWKEAAVMAGTKKTLVAAVVVVVMLCLVATWHVVSDGGGSDSTDADGAVDTASAASMTADRAGESADTDRRARTGRREDAASAARAGGSRDRERVAAASAAGAPDTDGGASVESPGASSAGGSDGQQGSRKPKKEEDPRPLARHVTGEIVDAATGEPVPGASAYLVTIDEGQVTGAWSAPAREDGGFGVGPRVSNRRADRFELRVRAPGYHDGFGPVEDGTVVRLDRRAHPLVPGSLAGVVTDSEGAPVVGRVRVNGSDNVGQWFGQWTETGQDGGFVIEGLRPGPWRFYVNGNTVRQEVTIPDGGEAHVQFRFRPDAELDERGKTRAVRVTGLPDGDGKFVRLHRSGVLQFWRERVVDGAAEFPTAQLGKWYLVLEDGHTATKSAAEHEVVAGEGALEIRWAPELTD